MPNRGPKKAHQQTLAQRLGRVLERVTRQSGRLQETPAYGSLLLGRVTESQKRRRIRIQVILTVLVMVANLIGIAVAALLVTVAIPEPSIFDDAPAWITFVVVPGYLIFAMVVGTYWITRRTVLALRWAIEERKPTPRRRAQHLPCPVAGRGRRPQPVGNRDGTVHDPLRPGQHAVHPAVSVRGRHLRRSGRHRRLSDHRVRTTPGGRSGARGGTTATAADVGPHGPNHDGLVPRFGGTGHRHRPGGFLPALDAKSDRDPIRRGRDDRVDRNLDLRMPPDVDPVLADRDPGAGGARRTQARRAGRLARQPGGIRRHRTR